MKHFILILISFLLFSCKADKDRIPDFPKKHVIRDGNDLRGQSNSGKLFSVEQVAEDEAYAEHTDRKAYQMTYDLFLPENEDKEKSLIVFLHPGAFLTGSKNDALIQRFCKDFAGKGYATLAANYRLADYQGGVGDLLDQLMKPGKLAKNQIYRSLQDAHSLLAYCEANAESWGVDPDRIYLAGYSAGAILALNYAYIDEREAFDFFQHDPLNCLDCLPYKGESEEDMSRGKIRGLIAIAGGIFELDHIEEKDQLPTLLIHGNEDDMVPYHEGIPFDKYKRDQEYEFQDTRINIPEGLSRFVIRHFSLPVYGSEEIYERKGKNVRLVEIEDKAHEFSSSGPEYEFLFGEIHAFLKKTD